MNPIEEELVHDDDTSETTTTTTTEDATTVSTIPQPTPPRLILRLKRKEIDDDDDHDDDDETIGEPSLKKRKQDETLDVEEKKEEHDEKTTEKDLSVWKILCRAIPDKTEEEQSAVQRDILGYSRLWNIPDGETFLRRWISHPNERVRMNIFAELSTYIGKFCDCIDDQVKWATLIAAKIIDYEQKHQHMFAMIEQGTAHLERQGIIEAQNQM